MRLLHTSDWHLGQTLHNFDRTYEHQCFLDWLLETIVGEQADALLIAGDVFDSANPSAAAQKQLYRFLQQARQRAPHLNIVIIAGNHDSPGRLEAPGPLLEAHGTTVIGHVLRGADGQIDLERLVVALPDAAGEVRAWCLAIPFLRPGDVPRLDAARDAAGSTEGDAAAATGAAPAGTATDTATDTAGAASEDTATDAARGDAAAGTVTGAAICAGASGAPAADPYLDGIALLYRQAFALAESKRASGQAILAMGHCYMQGSQSSLESERRIVIGGSEALPAAVFDPAIAYAALGHLHLAQRVGQNEHVRYCGSPLPLSFAEVGYRHQILRVDLDGAAVCAVTPLPVPRAVDLLRVPPKPAPLEQALAALEALALAPLPPHAQPFLEVRVLLDAPEPGLRARIEAAIEGRPVRLAKIEPTRARDAGNGELAPLSLDALAQLQPDDIFKRLYEQKYGAEAPFDQLSAFAELMLHGFDAAPAA